MPTLTKYWHNFKTQPDLWFFCGFLLTFTLSIRKVLNFFPIQGQFNEYTGIYLYASDVFLTLTLVFWLFSIIYNKTSVLSIVKKYRAYLLIPFLLVIWAFLSIVWSQNVEISLFRALKILELYLLFVYIIFRNTLSQEKCSTWNIFFKTIIAIALVQSVIAILQFILQHSIGLLWLKESVLSPDMPGVAKIVFDGSKIIRAYGLFPHPNILGGFLVFSIFITILYHKLFHVEQNERFLSVKCSTWNILILVIQILALILTFSKSAILGLILAFVYLYFKNVSPARNADLLVFTPENNKFEKIVPRGTILEDFSAGGRGTFFMNFRKYLKYALIIIPVILLLLFIVRLDFHAFFIKSLVERDLYLNVSRGTILANFWTGVGIGQFVPLMQNYSKLILEIWQFQPVHNVFLLVWSELGVIGLAIFSSFIFSLIFSLARLRAIFGLKNVPHLLSVLKMFHVEHFSFFRGGTFSDQKTSYPQIKAEHTVDNTTLVSFYFKAILMGFLFIMLFDHYFWDMQQGQIMLWMVAGLIVASREGRIDKI